MKLTIPRSHTSYALPGPPKDRSWNRLLIIAMGLSILIHSLFIYVSTGWQIADITQIERDVETLFKVQLKELVSRNFVSRPTHQQLIEERAKILQDNITSMSSQPSRMIDPEMNSMAPVLDPDTLPEWSEEGKDSPFDSDQPARELISSEISQKTVSEFETDAARSAIDDDVTPQPIPLAGRGDGTRRRIMANLPTPVLQDDPVVSRSIKTVLQKTTPPPAPELETSEPPIILPPINELLPSPELIRPNPGSLSLQTEEDAKKEIEDKFVRLDDLVRVELFTYHHIGGDGYFMVRIRPITADDRLRVLPKDVVFVLDASGSMGKKRLKVIKDELKKLLSRLRPEDRFNVVGFKQSVKRFARTLLPSSEENKKLAWRFINPLLASGRTDIYNSLQPLVQLGTERARPLVMILISDGRPNVGIVNSRKIINNLTSFQGPSTSIFCIGTGDELNRYLLDMLAFRNRGLVAFERSRSQLPDVIQSVFGYVEDPVLLQTRAHFRGIDETEIYPKSLPHLYLKGEIKIWGRLHGEKTLTLRLIGEAFDEQKEILLEIPIPERDTGTYEIARDWAFHKIYHIVGQMVEEESEKPEYLDEIRNLSRTYRVVTPYSEEN